MPIVMAGMLIVMAGTLIVRARMPIVRAETPVVLPERAWFQRLGEASAGAARCQGHEGSGGSER
jgi:hypothetical protein